MSASIHQEVVFEASPNRVYAALTDAKLFSQFSGGAPATIDAVPGGAFDCFGGRITGRNVEFVADKRVVQAWRAGNWPEGVYSILRFELEPKGSTTRLIFDQSGFPDGTREMLEGGWHKMYWEPMKALLAK